MTEPIVLVTGASGFIGRAVAARLADTGFTVRAGVRRARLPEALARTPRIAPVSCDLDDPVSLAAAVAGSRLIVHSAYGSTSEIAPQCRRLLAAMTDAGVEDLIHFSSIAVYGARTSLIRETDGPVGAAGGYGDAKIACEALIREWVAAREGRRALLLRPGAVYGRGGQLWTDKMIERIRVGAWGDFGAAAAGPAPLIHVDDVAEAVALAAKRYVGGRSADLDGVVALNLVGPAAPQWRQYFSALARAVGAPELRPVGPGALALRRALGLPAKAWARLGLPGLRRFALAPADGELALFRRDATISTEEAERRLGFRARIGLEEGLRRSVDPVQPKA